MRHIQKISAIPLLVAASVIVASCSRGTDESFRASGSVSGMRTVDRLIADISEQSAPRKSATLGVFVSEYLSNATSHGGVMTAVKGVKAQGKISELQSVVSEPDFQLLQAFSDALQVDVSDLLNRSDDRTKALDAYSQALTNIAMRANTRFKELSATEETSSDEKAALAKERSMLDRDVKAAVKAKDFATASEKQKLLSEKETALSETTLRLKQAESMLGTLSDLLTLYGQRDHAIKENREALITGVTVVDVPGIEDLKIIDTPEKSRTSRRSGEAFDALFQGTNVP